MNFFIWFGQAGWTAKSHVISIYLNSLSTGTTISGLTFGPSLKLFMEEHRKEANYKSIHDVNDLIKEFLKKPLDLDGVNQLEAEYGASLWKYAYADRKLVTYTHSRRYFKKDYTHKEILKIVCGMFKFFEREFKQNQIDCVALYASASAWTLVAYAVASKLGIPFRCLRSSEYPAHRAMWLDNPIDQWKQIEKAYRSYSDNPRIDEEVLCQSKKYLNDFRERKPKPGTIRPTVAPDSFKALFNLNRIKGVLQPFLHYYKRDRINTLPPIGLRIQDWWQYRRGKRRVLRKRSRYFEEIRTGETYAYFPLHYEPEATLMIWALNYTNQLALVEQIARTLPVTWKLYLKEHPMMVGRRSEQHYRHLRRIPNVRLIDPTIDGAKLIEGSKCVITITGTSGWEAAILKKPSITLGSVFYHILPMVYPVNCVQEIPQAIQWVRREYQHDEDALEKFIAALITQTFELPLDYHWGILEDNLEKIQELQRYTEELGNRLLESLNTK